MKRPNHFLTVPELTYKPTFWGLNRDQQSAITETIQEQMALVRYAFEDVCNLSANDRDFPVTVDLIMTSPLYANRRKTLTQERPQAVVHFFWETLQQKTYPKRNFVFFRDF
jgi:hypothetical protein